MSAEGRAGASGALVVACVCGECDVAADAVCDAEVTACP